MYVYPGRGFSGNQSKQSNDGRVEEEDEYNIDDNEMDDMENKYGKERRY